MRGRHTSQNIFENVAIPTGHICLLSHWVAVNPKRLLQQIGGTGDRSEQVLWRGPAFVMASERHPQHAARPPGRGFEPRQFFVVHVVRTVPILYWLLRLRVHNLCQTMQHGDPQERRPADLRVVAVLL